MKSRLTTMLQAIAKGVQMALQLDFFSDFLVPDKIAPARPIKPFAPSNSATPTPTPTPSAGNKRRILINDDLLEYELRRSKRRSIGFLITDQGLRITAPRWVTIADIENAIHEKKTWITNKLSERRERASHSPKTAMRWEHGAALPYLGRDIRLWIDHSKANGIVFDQEQERLVIGLPADASEQQLKDRVQVWLQAQARQIFNQRLPFYADKLNVSYHSMSLSSATTRWGSCTSQGKIRLNWRLIHFSPNLIDYVIAHELSHRREMNHSPRFWQTVQSVFPEMELAKQQLKRHAAQTLPEF